MKQPMTPQELIDRYAHDIARRLPWKQRESVESELRGLLSESLTSGQVTNLEQTEDLLIEFGAPAEVAARYDQPNPVIDAVDSRRFWRIAAGGMFALVVVAAALSGQAPATTEGGVGGSLAELNTSLVATGLLLLGALTLMFATVSTLRRRARRASWTPMKLSPVKDPNDISRRVYAGAVALAILGTFLLVKPDLLLWLITSGTPTQPVLQAFAYDATFLSTIGPFVFGALLLGIALLSFVALKGRWQVNTRRAELILGLLMASVLMAAVQAGPIFVAQETDTFVKTVLAILIAWILLDLWAKWERLRPKTA